MNISQPFIHRPINFTIAANDQIIDAEPFDDAIIAYRNGGPIRVRDIGQTIPGLRDITLMVSPWASRALGSLVGRWCLRCLALASPGTSAAHAAQDRPIKLGRAPGALATCHTGPIWLAVRGCATSPLGPTAPCVA
jgi:hypothetical protein